jgi:uncharacterized protein YdaU (DUF1376 family)
VTPPKMPIHIGDYKRDTGHLRALEHGAYLLLLFHHWSTGALPDDDRQLSAIACMTPAEWKRAKPLLAKFFQPGWVHHRVLIDLQEANESYQKLSSAGSKGGKARAENKRRLSEATSDASSDDQASFKQPITDNQKEDRIGDARASSFTKGSKALASAFWKALGFESALAVHPDYAGTDWRAIEWEKAGWTIDLIDTETRRVGPDKPLNYYEKVFATSFAKRQAPLPVVEIREAEKVTVAHGTSQNRSGGSLTASLRRDLAALEQSDGPDNSLPASRLLRLSN